VEINSDVKVVGVHCALEVDGENVQEVDEVDACGGGNNVSNVADSEIEKQAEANEKQPTRPQNVSTDKEDRRRPLLTFLRAYMRSLLSVDETAIVLVPPLRTALLLACEWVIWGIGNPNTTAFQLGALYVALVDPCGNLSKRLHYMGLTEICVVIVGAVIPSLVWDRRWLDFIVGIPIAYITGLSPLLGSPALQQALKLSTALFAINGAINRNTNGYGGPWVSIFWTFLGATASLMLALIPELLGNREAVRTDLFKLWHGFGKATKAWSSKWSTKEHIQTTPVPIITMVVRKTTDNVFKDKTEDPRAKEWLLSIMKSADRIRELSLCLANAAHQARHECTSFSQDNEPKTDVRDINHDADTSINDESSECYSEFYIAMGNLCNKLAFALQFPWIVRYIPVFRRRISRDLAGMKYHGSKLNKLYPSNLSSKLGMYRWLPALVNMLQEELESVKNQIMDNKCWPPFSSVSSLPKRIAAAFPPKLPNKLQKDDQKVIRSYAVRFTLAFSIASIPELVLGEGFSSHWFSMTVALIMGPTESATYRKVGDRILGTVLGVGMGSALIPLYEYPAALIVLLGLITYAVCIFFKANYSLFTFFITVWVLTTSAGAGADLGVTIFYRICWTFAAGLLVVLVTYIYPPKLTISTNEKLAACCRALKPYAQSVLKHNTLRASCNDAGTYPKGRDIAMRKLIAQANSDVDEARQEVIKTRLDMLNCIHDAVLTPYQQDDGRIDPHILAPALASDIIDAIVVPRVVTLIEDGSADDLMADFDEETWDDLDRLIDRLENAHPMHSPRSLRSARTLTSISDTISNSQNSVLPCVVDRPKTMRGPFSNAIAAANKRLDDAGFPELPSTTTRNSCS
jgi:hypothetical protein